MNDETIKDTAQDVAGEPQETTLEESQEVDDVKEDDQEPQEAQPEEESEADEVTELKGELEKAQKEADEYKERMLRTQADFENYKKRSIREKDDLAQYTKEEFVKKLLPVLDNLDLALGHSSTENIDAYRKGVELVLKQFIDVLDKEGLKEIETENAAFDPNYHHGVAVDNNPDVEDQHITEVFQKGYELKGKVLRPAMVKVNQK